MNAARGNDLQVIVKHKPTGNVVLSFEPQLLKAKDGWLYVTAGFWFNPATGSTRDVGVWKLNLDKKPWWAFWRKK